MFRTATKAALSTALLMLALGLVLLARSMSASDAVIPTIAAVGTLSLAALVLSADTYRSDDIAAWDYQRSLGIDGSGPEVLPWRQAWDGATYWTHDGAGSVIVVRWHPAPVTYAHNGESVGESVGHVSLSCTRCGESLAQGRAHISPASWPHELIGQHLARH